MLNGTHHAVTRRAQQPVGIQAGNVPRPALSPNSQRKRQHAVLHPIIHKGRIITASRGFVNIPASCPLNADRAKLKSRAVSPGHSLAADSTNLLAIQVQVLPSQTHTLLPATHPRGRLAAMTTINVRSSSFKGPL